MYREDMPQGRGFNARQTRAGQAAREAEALSRVVVEGLQEGVIVTDAALRATSWNASALRILDLADEDLAGGLTAPFLPDLRIVDERDGRTLGPGESLSSLARDEGGAIRGMAVRGEQWIRIHARPLGESAGAGAGVVVTFADVTATIQTQRRLAEERDRAQRYLEVASTLVVVLDARGCVELVNRQGCELLGFAEDELRGRDWFDAVVPAADRLDARREFARLVAGGEPTRDALVETFVRTKDGDDRKIAWRNSVLRNDAGTITAVLRSGEDVTERRRAEAQVAYLAYHDALTGLPNRAQLEEQLRLDLVRARRSGEAVALVCFDLDNFKLVNDSLGHAGGDELLRETARRVSDLVRGGDVLARQGGDEFLLLMHCSGADAAASAAQLAARRIAAALERPFEIADAEFHVGASIGVALFPEHATDAESLLKRADAAMYQAKRTGSGSVALYQQQEGDARARLSLTSRLRRAIGEGELRLHYQPIVSLSDGCLTGVEALVRWDDPQHGLVPPADFIPIAEETGLIDGIGDWVVEELCVAAARWAGAGQRPRLSFNLSPRQLRRTDLVSSIAARIDAHGLRPEQFCAELTETAIMSDAHRHRSLLDELHEAGLTIAIDDFGAGHSSLARLRDLPVQVLKVDRAFLDRVPNDRGSAAIVAAILSLADALDMTTIVEGIETDEQLLFLQANDCPFGQGYLLGRPVPAEALTLLSDAPAR
ncbi:putative bifunctional diguanylate cyclase/phosphodiesterase [Conexibacter woesei]|uniref:putative bifunctional diguanylate cyclase/phosphodiesterase n=1 Tax=Conexibacter woesei TaxID=191495 RepID=UPI000683D83A